MIICKYLVLTWSSFSILDIKIYMIRHHLVSQFEVKQNVLFDLTWTGSIYW